MPTVPKVAPAAPAPARRVPRFATSDEVAKPDTAPASEVSALPDLPEDMPPLERAKLLNRMLARPEVWLGRGGR